MISFTSCVLALSALSSTAASLCTSSESSPNPIRAQYPNLTTGVINGTIGIIPIPFSQARNMVPSRYNILTHAYRALLPSFPDDLYPIVLQAVLDHDIGSSTVRIPDFSRSVISFPFVDMLGDNYTSFRIGPAPLISDNPVAVAGAAVYGPPLPEVGNFDPSCDGYRFVQGTKNGEIMFDGYSGLIKVPGQSPVVRTRFTPISNQPYPIEFYKNVTNQPSTGTENGKLCDNFISLFNSTATTGKNAPVPVKGSVTLKKPLLQYEQTFADVYGLKLTLAFIENNYLPCPKLQGYGTT